MPSNSSHVLLAAPPAWGHLRPLIGFACKLVQKRPGSIVITLPVVGDFKQSIDKEIDRYLLSKEDEPLKNDIHVISLGGEGKDIMVLMPNLIRAFESLYISLHTLTPIRCTSGVTHTYTQTPNVVIADCFFLLSAQIVRKITLRKVPILCWNPSALGPQMRLSGPEVLGGLGDIEVRAKALAEETNISYEGAEKEIVHSNTGQVVAPPGMPPMYDYEYYASEIDPPRLSMKTSLFKQCFTMLHECDGMLSATSAVFEPEGTEATAAWYAKSNKLLYAVGPIFPDHFLEEISSDLKTIPEEEKEVVTFLNKVYASSGAHSLVYISFGTMFWPKGEGIWNIFEYIIDTKIPLLISYDELRLGKMPERILKKFSESEIALVSNWTPQQAVLQHRATGWFMTHCGHNSMMEAVIQGVPMIAWPMEAEQPGSAAYLSLKLNIAYQVIEGRTGLGLKPMYRGVTPKGNLEALSDEIKEILKQAFGEDGKVKRENIQILKQKMRAGLREGGASVVNLERFIRDYLSG